MKQIVLIAILAILTSACSKKSFSSKSTVASEDANVENNETVVDPFGEPEDIKNSDDDDDQTVSMPGDLDIDVPSRMTVGEAEGTVQIEYTFNQPLTRTTRYNVQIQEVSAKQGEDFGFASAITAYAGDETMTLEIPIIDDMLWDVGNETFVIQLADDNGGLTDSTEITIVDNETQPLFSLKVGFYTNPTGTSYNALIADTPADQDLKIVVRTDREGNASDKAWCQSRVSTGNTLAEPGIHYNESLGMEVTIGQFGVESTEFNFDWLPLPSQNVTYTICFHIDSVSAQ